MFSKLTDAAHEENERHHQNFSTNGIGRGGTVASGRVPLIHQSFLSKDSNCNGKHCNGLARSNVVHINETGEPDKELPMCSSAASDLRIILTAHVRWDSMSSRVGLGYTYGSPRR